MIATALVPIITNPTSQTHYHILASHSRVTFSRHIPNISLLLTSRQDQRLLRLQLNNSVHYLTIEEDWSYTGSSIRRGAATSAVGACMMRSVAAYRCALYRIFTYDRWIPPLFLSLLSFFPYEIMYPRNLCTHRLWWVVVISLHQHQQGWMACRRRKYYYWEDGIQIAIGSMLKLTSIGYITHRADISSLEKHDFSSHDLPPFPPPPPCPTVSPPSLPASIKHSPRHTASKLFPTPLTNWPTRDSMQPSHDQ